MALLQNVKAFDAYKKYVALKLHFSNDKYDYFINNGAVKVSKESYLSRKDKYYFEKLAKKYKVRELEILLVSNFINNNDLWVGDLFKPECENQARNFQARLESLTYRFTDDLKNIIEQVKDDKGFLLSKDGEHPKLLKFALRNEINVETLIILNDIMNLFPVWDMTIKDDIIWPNFKMKCLKYSPFVKYEKNKFKSILKKALSEIKETKN